MLKPDAARKAKIRTSEHGGNRLQVVSRPIVELKLDRKNPRLHSKKQIHQIACSIQAFGFNVPILIDRQDQVVAGYGRALAAQKLGWHEIPTIRLEHLTDAQALAFRIADNRLTEISTWDEQLLGEQLKSLTEVKLEFSLEATGFEMGEIDLLIEGIKSQPDGKPDPADALPDPGPSVSQPGDLWLLGPHRLFSGNALEEASYRTLMEGKHAALVFTDPPYNVVIDGHTSGLGRIKHREFMMASGELSPAEFTAFLLKTCTLLKQYSDAGSVHFICIDWRHIGELLAAGRQVYAELKNVYVWVKDAAGMGSLYRSQHEFVLVFKHGREAHRNNVELGKYGRSRTNVWHYPGVHSFARSSEEGNLLALHPTVKPVALVADALLDCSGRGEIVLDAFVGSGTTFIAAERTGRVCCGMELDPIYVDTAIRRWQRWTGQQARHATSGKLFDELETKRGEPHGN